MGITRFELKIWTNEEERHGEDPLEPEKYQLVCVGDQAIPFSKALDLLGLALLGNVDGFAIRRGRIREYQKAQEAAQEAAGETEPDGPSLTLVEGRKG